MNVADDRRPPSGRSGGRGHRGIKNDRASARYWSVGGVDMRDILAEARGRAQTSAVRTEKSMTRAHLRELEKQYGAKIRALRKKPRA